MAGEWRTATVAELQREGVLLVEDGNHGEYRPRPDEFVDRGVAFIRAADMDGGRVLFESAAKINERARQRITKGIGASGDVLLSHKGTVGKVALVPSDVPPFVCSPQTTFWRTLNENQLDRRYLYAFLRSPAFHAQLATRAGETDMAPYVSLTSQRGLLVVLPSAPDQRAIADILGTLDDRIEVNRRMSEMLEAMARALFKSWFVDFDPVRAKAEGRDTGLSQSLADLFPARFEDSESRQVPEGWAAKPLGSWVDTLSGGTPSRTESRFWDGDIPWISPKVMNSIHADDPEAHVTTSAIAKGTRLAPAGSTLVMVRGMGLHEGVRVSQAHRAVTFNQDVKALVGTSIDPTLLLFALLDAQRVLLDRVESSGHGTGKLPSEVLLSFPIAMPAGPTQARLSEPFHAMNERIGIARGESRTLAALRDALLPKLLSGELRVRDAERLAERPGA
jgi:type I restriction enzyme, S subunit